MHQSTRLDWLFPFQGLQDNLLGGAVSKRLEPIDHLWAKASVTTSWGRINHHPTADSNARREPPQDEPVSPNEGNRPVQADLGPASLAWSQHFCAQQTHTRRHLGRSRKKVNLCVVLERAGRIREITQLHID